MMQFYFKDIQTPLGDMRAVVTDDALVVLSFKDSKDFQTAIQKIKSLGTLTRVMQHPMIDRIFNELTAYFYGECDAFKTPVHFYFGTPFQHQVWEALKSLNIGETVTYSDIANMIERPKSTRAVASAIGQNPLSIIIPCHRVLRKDGGLGGFNSGLPRKERLLTHEARIANKTTH